jgi:hypothetical protein
MADPGGGAIGAPGGGAIPGTWLPCDTMHWT